MAENKRVAILTYDGAAMFELGCAVELFALPRPEFASWYQTDVVTFSEGPLNVTGGLQLSAKRITSLSAYDMLVIPSWPTSGDNLDKHLATQIVQFSQAGKRLLSFCSGAFLLAELGLLDGRRAVTHWRYADTFKQRFPSVGYHEDVLYLYDGKLGCSAGSAAAMDLGIEVIRQDFGYQVANQVARRLVMSAHRKGGQSQFVEAPLLAVPNQFAEALDWAIQHIGAPIHIDSLARRANMSRRTFDRKFRSALNLAPKEWLVQQRLNRARQLIEDTQHSIEQIAEFSGFDNATTLRHHFRKQMKVSPRQYRDQFGRSHDETR